MMRKENNSIYIYVETAFSHEGDLSYLYKQVDEAVKAGADAVKFQILLDAAESYTADVINSSDVFNWAFTEEQWVEVIKYARSKGLETVLLPVDMKALNFCERHLDLFEYIEVHSINFNHKFMLEKMDELENKIVILGIGGRTIDDIIYALSILSKSYSQKRILLMHGFQSFPTEPKNIKIGMISKMSDLFELPVGYADHSSYAEDDTLLLQLAYAEGARYFEKHMVLEKGVERTDYQAAVAGEDIKNMRSKLEYTSLILGDNSFLELNEAEKAYRGREKKIVAISDINENDVFTRDNIGYKVSMELSEFEQKDIEKLLGKVANRDYKANQNI